MISRHPRHLIDILRRREGVNGQAALLADQPDVISGSNQGTSTTGGAPQAAQAIEERAADPTGVDLYAGRVWDIAGQPYVYSGAAKKFVRVGAGLLILPAEFDPTGSSSGDVLTSTGGASAPGWAAPAGGGGGGGSGALTIIAQVVLAADTATFDVSSIAGTYEDLLLTLQARTDSANVGVRIRCNNDSGANYDYSVESRGGSAAAAAQTSGLLAEVIGSGGTANFAATATVHIPKYARTTFFKQMDVRMGRPDGPYAEQGVVQWRGTAAINRITLLFTDTTKFKTGSVLTIYGIGGAGAAATTAEATAASDTTMTTSNTDYDLASISLDPGTWYVHGQSSVEQPSGAAHEMTMRIRDGSTIYAGVEVSSPGGNVIMGLSCGGLVTLSATTSIKLTGRNNLGGDIARYQRAVAGTTVTNYTKLTAVRMA